MLSCARKINSRIIKSRTTFENGKLLKNKKNQLRINLKRGTQEKIRFFHEHLVQIFAHYETMQTKSLKNSNYKQAAETTKRLLISLVTAKNKFVYESGDFDEFKN